jgi:DNA-binding response OmpR family regulator
MSRILILDRELGFMWALAESLKTRGIETIPSTSVEEAEAILAALQPDLALLIVNCAVERACVFAERLRGKYQHLKVIGITSRGYRCRKCARLMIATLSDPEDRAPDRLQHCVELICILIDRSGLGGAWWRG